MRQATIEREPLRTRPDKLLRYAGMIALLHERRTSAEHLKDQVVTELAESLDSEMRTGKSPIRLRVRDGHVLDVDGRSMTTSAAIWAELTQARADEDPSLQWFADFARVEAEEHDALAEFYDTATTGDVMVVVSAMPENASHDAVRHEGFRPDISRSYARAYTKIIDGIEERIQSVDHASVARWNTVLGTSHETAQQLLAMRRRYTGVSADSLLDTLAAGMDTLLYTETGNIHTNGRPDGGTIEANTFVLRHEVIVSQVIADLRAIPRQTSQEQANRLINNIFYNAKAALEARHTLFVARKNDMDYSASTVSSMMSADGKAAADQGKTYGGCSGQSSIDAQEAGSDSLANHSLSFTRPDMPLNPDHVVMRATECPHCCMKVVAPYDTKNKVWLGCANRNCTAYSSGAMTVGKYAQKARVKQTAQAQTTTDLLHEVFFGSPKKGR